MRPHGWILQPLNAIRHGPDKSHECPISTQVDKTTTIDSSRSPLPLAIVVCPNSPATCGIPTLSNRFEFSNIHTGSFDDRIQIVNDIGRPINTIAIIAMNHGKGEDGNLCPEVSTTSIEATTERGNRLTTCFTLENTTAGQCSVIAYEFLTTMRYPT